MKFVFAVAATAIWAASNAAAAPAKPLPRYGVFVYSNLCTEKESGDAAGSRLTLLRYGDGDHVLFEWSEGPRVEAAGYKVKFDASTGELTFEVDIPGAPPEPQYSQSYTGKVSQDAIALRSNSGPERTYRLPRLYDFSRKTGICR